jgi:hypothetical protein
VKSLIILFAIILTGSIVYAGDSDLIVDGKVGVGTLNPDAQLQVVNSATATPIVKAANSTATGYFRLNDPGNISADGVLTSGFPGSLTGIPNNFNSAFFQLQDVHTYNGTVDDEHANILNNMLITATANNSSDNAYALSNTTAYNSPFNFSGTIGSEQNTVRIFDGTVSFVTGLSSTANLYGATATTVTGLALNASLYDNALSTNHTSHTSGLIGSLVSATVNANSADWNVSANTVCGINVTVLPAQSNGGVASIGTSYGIKIGSCRPPINAGTVDHAYGLYIDPQTGATYDNYAIYAAGGTNYFGGNVGIGTTNTGTGGSAALVFGNGTKPIALNNAAGLYAKDVDSTTELYSFDEAGNETLQSPHAGDAPDWLYDAGDGIPMIVKEVQYFLGYVRYTNQTRQARMAGMTDAEKSALSAGKRNCVYMEAFADHNTRLGLSGPRALVKLDWDTEQQAIKARRDVEIAAARKAKADLQATIASVQDGEARADLISQDAKVEIPAEYVVKAAPARLRAALDAARW